MKQEYYFADITQFFDKGCNQACRQLPTANNFLQLVFTLIHKSIHQHRAKIFYVATKYIRKQVQVNR
jgi:hypothetical protein